MGLRIMSYRAEVIGAKLIIRARPNGGTMVICVLPRVPANGHERDDLVQRIRAKA
jgi:nitrate/nitrite-specific signal transduction histidine kinase